MSEVYLITIRLDHTKLFLVVDRPSHRFLLDSDHTIMAFRTLADARASYPGVFIPMNASRLPPEFVLDLDAVLTWCAKPPPRPIESVDQSEIFGDVIDLLDKLLEAAALCTEETRDFRAAEGVVLHVLGANVMTEAIIPNLSPQESEQLRAMFQAGIGGLRRALPRDLVGTQRP